MVAENIGWLAQYESVISHEGNTEGILVNEPKPAAAGSDTNPATDMSHIQKIPFVHTDSSLSPEQRKAWDDDLARRLASIPDPWAFWGEALEDVVKDSWNKYGDYVHTALDLAAVIPVAGFIFDGINGVLYSVEGDTANAIASFSSAAISAFPGGKVVSTTVKTVLKNAKKVIKPAKGLVKRTKSPGKNDGIAVKDGRKKPANNKECPSVGHPVNPVLGIKFLAGETELDFTLPSYFPLIWQRRYFSDIAEDGWFGQGWTVPFSQCLKIIDDKLYYINEQGSKIPVPSLSEDQTKFDVNNKIFFSRECNNRYVVKSKDKKEKLIFSPLTIDENDTSGIFAKRFPLVAVIDNYNNHIRILYNNDGTPKAIKDAVNKWLIILFSKIDIPNGTKLKRLTCLQELVDNKRINKVSYGYSSEGDLIFVNNDRGKTLRKYVYKNHLLIKHELPGGLIASYKYNEYNPSGKVIEMKNNLGQRWGFLYKKNETMVIDTIGRVTRYKFNQDKQWTAFIDARGQETKYFYDKNGRVLTIVTPDNLKEIYSYDYYGNITSVTGKNKKSKYFKYDSNHNVTHEKDEAGNLITYSYDSSGGMTKIINPLGYVTEFKRNDKGLITELIESDNRKSYIKYNELGYVSSQENCEGNISLFSRNKNGDITCITYQDGKTKKFIYDDNHNLISTLDRDGSSEYYYYDSLNRQISEQNSAGELTSWELSIDGLPIKKTIANGEILTYHYDSERRLVSIKNENGAYFLFKYDDNDNIICNVTFDNAITYYKYNEADELIWKLEVGNEKNKNSLGIETYLYRDPSGNLLKKITTDHESGKKSESIYKYNDIGLLVYAANECSTLTFQYNSIGRCIEETTEVMGVKRRLRYHYDNLGNRIKITLPDSSQLKYLYYGDGNLLQVNFNNEVISEMERDCMGHEIIRKNKCDISYFNYNLAGKITKQQVFSFINSSCEIKSKQLIYRKYDYDLCGKLKSTIDCFNENIKYHYDEISQLTQYNNESFCFDSSNNVREREDEKVNNNRVSLCGNNRYLYNKYGSVIRKEIGINKFISISYTPEHQIDVLESSSGDKVLYGYDPFGRRVFKKESNVMTTYLWDGEVILSEYKSKESIIYIYNADNYTPISQIIKNNNCSFAKEIYYYHTDQLGTPREMTDLNGNIIWQASYSALGNVNSQMTFDKLVLGENIHQPLRFPGQYYDKESGFHYNCNRYYDPDIGRYITPDYTRVVLRNNPYQYSPNPINWTNPNGV